MLSKDEIEAFLDDGDDYQAVSPTHSPVTAVQPIGGIGMVTLAARTQVAMFRVWQSAVWGAR